MNEQKPVGPDFRPPERVELERQFLERSMEDGKWTGELTAAYGHLLCVAQNEPNYWQIGRVLKAIRIIEKVMLSERLRTSLTGTV